ncbi:MAG: hypothetical protein GXO26_04565 [Crenarchaeota archaeon]|nr:hypothetical protein [Thermoproteota archaeon]
MRTVRIFLPLGKPSPILAIYHNRFVVEFCGYISRIVTLRDRVTELYRKCRVDSTVGNLLIYSRPCILVLKSCRGSIKRVVHNLPIEEGFYDHYLQVMKHVQFKLRDRVSQDEIEKMYYRLDADYYITWLVGEHVVEAIFLKSVDPNIEENLTLLIETDIEPAKLDYTYDATLGIAYVDLDCTIDIDTYRSFRVLKYGKYRFFADTLACKADRYVYLVGRARYVSYNSKIRKFSDKHSLTIVKL